MMKKIKKYALSVLLAFAACMMTACGGSDHNATSSESTAQTTVGGETGTDRTDGTHQTESTGVIDGMIDDVESGVDSAVDGITGQTEDGRQQK